MSDIGRHDLARHYESKAIVRAAIGEVFAHVDDHTQFSSHMNQSSWLMGGSRMEIHLDDGRGQKPGSRIRLTGTVFGCRLSVEEVVTERVVRYKKTWETIGHPRLLIIGHYRMGFELSPDNERAMLRVFIDYALPEQGVGRWFGFLFANFYARWCTQRMLNDTVRHFATRSQADRQTIGFSGS